MCSSDLTVLRDNSGTNIIVEQDTPKSPTKGGAAESAPKKKRVARVTKFEHGSKRKPATTYSKFELLAFFFTPFSSKFVT